MRYEKQKDGASWLFYEKLAPRSRRRLALVHFNPITWKLEKVERLDASDEELAEIEVTIPAIKLPKVIPAANELRIAVVCEGETESRYVRELCTRLGIADRVDISVSVLKDPGLVFEKVAGRMMFRKTVGSCKVDETWLVFDRDSHKHFAEACEWADSVPFVRTAFTNPCFEFWMLLHYKNFKGKVPRNRQIEVDVKEERIEHQDGIVELVQRRFVKEESSPEACLQTLKSFTPGYVKNGEKTFDEHSVRIKEAYRRARALPSPDVGQGSQLPDLMDRLCEMAGVSLDEAFVRWSDGNISADDAPLNVEKKADPSAAQISNAPSVKTEANAKPNKEQYCREAAQAVHACGSRAIGNLQYLEDPAHCPKVEDFLTLEGYFGKGLEEENIRSAAAQFNHKNPEDAILYLTQTLNIFIVGKTKISVSRTRTKIVAALRAFRKMIEEAKARLKVDLAQQEKMIAITEGSYEVP